MKTAVLTQSQKIGAAAHTEGAPERADLAASTQAAIVEVLVKKSMAKLARYPGLFVIKGGAMDTSALDRPGLGAVEA